MSRYNLLLSVLVLLSATAHGFDDEKPIIAVSKVKFPRVSQVNGKVFLFAKDAKPLPLKKDQILKERAIIETGPGAQLRLELDEKNGLTLLASSKIEIPVISWDAGEVTDVNLLEGRMRVDSWDQNQRYYNTPITHDVYADADFILDFAGDTGKASLTVFRGALDFRGLENEISARVAAGEQASFQGVIEGGHLMFDILLKGRKVARGKLSGVMSLSKTDLAKWDKETLIKKPIVPKVPLKPPLQPGQICEDPNAKLNECSWVCEGQPKKPGKKVKICDVEKSGISCVRRRCNANGQWGDAFTLPIEQNRCEPKPVVAACDY